MSNTLATAPVTVVPQGVRNRLAARTGFFKWWEGKHGGKYHLVQTWDQFWYMYKQLKEQPLVVVDTETSGFDWVRDRVAGIVLGWGVEHNYYLPIGHDTGELQLDIEDIRRPLQEVLGNPKVTKVFWNMKFDRHFLRKVGLEITGVRHDGIVLVHLLDENTEKGLKAMANLYVHPQADVWETELTEWRNQEAKSRKKLFGQLLKDSLDKDRAEIQAEFFRANPMIQFSGLTKAQLTARLKAYVKTKLLNHPLARNKKEDISYDQIPLDIITPYACSDVHYTFLLYNRFVNIVGAHDAFRRLYINEMQLSDLLFEVESHGVKIDVPYLHKIEPLLDQEIESLQKDIFADVGHEFDLESNDQLIQALQKMNVKLSKLTKKGQEAVKDGDFDKVKYAVDKEVLEALGATHPFANKILEYRKNKKRKNTYVINIRELVDEKHMLHSTFNANVATGRMSSREPNIQNIEGRDKTVRKAFTIPEEIGKEGLDIANSEWLFIFFDYSQVELRLTAHWSQDPTFMAAYCPGAPGWLGREQDLHTITCGDVVMGRSVQDLLAILATENDDKPHPDFNDVKWYRNIAKRVNFGIIYGAGPGAIQRQVSTPKRPVSRDACQEYINGYFRKYQGVQSWIKETEILMKRQGSVQNSFGRCRRLPNVKSHQKWEVERACRQGVNFLIQGDAADLFKHAAVRVNKILKKHKAKTRIVNFVHDEIQFYWHKSEIGLLREVKAAMEDWPQFRVPIVVEMELSYREWGNKRKPKGKH